MSERAPTSSSHAAISPQSGERTRSERAAEPVITQSQIVRLKATLKLKPEQHSQWASVETMLNEIARDRTSTVSETTIKLRRLKAIAGPLIKSLDESQKSDAVSFARRIGYGQLAAAF